MAAWKRLPLLRVNFFLIASPVSVKIELSNRSAEEKAGLVMEMSVSAVSGYSGSSVISAWLPG